MQLNTKSEEGDKSTNDFVVVLNVAVQVFIAHGVVLLRKLVGKLSREIEAFSNNSILAKSDFLRIL